MPRTAEKPCDALRHICPRGVRLISGLPQGNQAVDSEETLGRETVGGAGIWISATKGGAEMADQ